MVKSCRRCKRAFHPSAAHYVLCWDCWREQHDGQLRLGEYERGRTDGYEEGWRHGERAGYEAGLREGAVVLAPELLGDLIRLVHPDRHPAERYELANRVTAQLVAMRDSVRGGG